MEFVRELERLVAQIPRGRIATFTELAKALGDEAATTAVFRILRDTPITGAHRVVRASGDVARARFATLLRAEGVPVSHGRVEGLDDLRLTEFHGPQPLARLREDQRQLATRVVEEDGFASPERIAGFDLAYSGDYATAAVAVVSLADREVVQTERARVRVRFPYIPGYLAYREFPGIRRCYALLDAKPDVLMVDGHGILHPARFGIASFVGVSLNCPTIGVAKNLLVGDVGPPPRNVGDITEVRVDSEVRGYALRSSPSRRLLYVSVGHLISLDTAVGLTKRMCKTRMPEPLRLAHLLAKKTERKKKKKRKDG